MSQQERWQSTLSDALTPAGNPLPNMPTDVSSTFVKPLQDAPSPPTSPHTPSTGTPIPIPPPPPYWYPYASSPVKSKRGYLIAIVVLALMVVGLGSLEVVQLAGGKLLTTSSSGSPGSNQSSQSAITPAQNVTAALKTTPVRTLTPGTIKENVRLTCGVCNDPVLTTINTITLDTTNLRVIWVVKLNNHSGAQQIDYFSDFSLQDPSGNTYKGTGDLDTPSFLSAGQIVLETEIFSFLPRPGVSYTLIARLGSSGVTYDPLQFTF